MPKEPPLPPVVTRVQAYAAKRKRYFTGYPCIHGHMSPRYVSTGGCIECLARFKNAPSPISLGFQVWEVRLVIPNEGMEAEVLTEIRDRLQGWCDHLIRKAGKTPYADHIAVLQGPHYETATGLVANPAYERMMADRAAAIKLNLQENAASSDMQELTPTTTTARLP